MGISIHSEKIVQESKEMERASDPYKTPVDWRDLGPANLDPAFLFPETDNKCPINKNVRKHATEASAEYMLLIQSHLQM